METFDVVVLGAGPAGENVADYAIRGSDRTAAIVEAELVGGECSYWACMPSKALLRPLDVLSAAENLGGLPPSVLLDREALLRRRDEWVSHYDDQGQVGWAQGAGIEVVRGVGRLAGERLVEVNGEGGTRTLRARHAVVLATGSTPVIPPEFADVLPWTSRDATGIVETPDSIAVVGGGVVACEASRWLAALGVKTTMLVRGSRLLAGFEPFVSEFVADGLATAGVEVRFGVSVTSAHRPDAVATGVGRVHGGPVRLVDSVARESCFSEVLVATGRRPALDEVGLDSIGLTAQQLAHSKPEWLHLVGDVSGEAPLTHWGKYRARQVGDQIAARAEGRDLPAPPAMVPVPQVVFTDPQVGSVGMSAERARSQGRRVRTVSVPWSSAAGAALLRDGADGRAELVIDEESSTLLGATFVGAEVAELVHAATIAITGQVPLDTLWHAVAAYPTASELWLRLLDADREGQRAR